MQNNISIFGKVCKGKLDSLVESQIDWLIIFLKNGQCAQVVFLLI